MVLTRSDLGKNNVSGVEVTGTQETRVFAAGVIGNDRPISITKEFWYSPHLGLNMLVKRNDPRVGTQTFTVTEVSLAEPDPKYFHVPEGFRVVDMRSTSGKRAAGQGTRSIFGHTLPRTGVLRSVHTREAATDTDLRGETCSGRRRCLLPF